MKLFNKGIRRTYKFERLVAQQYGASKTSFFFYMSLRIIVIAIMVLSIINKRYEHIGQCLLTLVLFCLPPFFERGFKADLPSVFEIIVLCFAFASNILGEIFSFYVKIPGWDTMLHTIYGFFCAALGFSLIDILNKDTSVKFKLHPAYLCINSFGFTMAVGVLWEFFECSMDYFFGKDMQKDTIVHSFNTVMLDDTKSNIPITVDNIHEVIIDGYKLPFDGYLDIGLFDTMKDLAVAALGASVFCIFLVAYLKTKGQNKIAAMFIPVKRNWENDPAEIEADLAKRIVNLESELNELRAEHEKKKAEEQKDDVSDKDSAKKHKNKGKK